MAGKEVQDSTFGRWIRPVSGRSTGELSDIERCLDTGHDPLLLDVITIQLLKPQPKTYHQEDHLIDDAYYWVWRRRASVTEVGAAIDQISGSLWLNRSSSYHGLHDRIAEQDAIQTESSLKLILVNDLNIEVAPEGYTFGNGKRKVRANFSLNGIRYRLTVTDSIQEKKYLLGSDGLYDVGRAILCVSLSELWGGYAYKLIAAVIIIPDQIQIAQPR